MSAVARVAGYARRKGKDGGGGEAFVSRTCSVEKTPNNNLHLNVAVEGWPLKAHAFHCYPNRRPVGMHVLQWNADESGETVFPFPVPLHHGRLPEGYWTSRRQMIGWKLKSLRDI
ncbi:hypothetical protein CEXT_49221 [Caerostris extrusa]|uniref:Uncharacterized protein n=1 Tax=Caerostris extrusa TaxID=172846 RepID=A0AAV4XQ72_CAEEX|nr:hypothetical protein CEXT_49221 [Caerostris extrusa]